MAEIKLRGITRAWGSFVGVDAIDLEVRDKEFMVFLGPSGCGKTTTMRMIAGLEEPDCRAKSESMASWSPMSMRATATSPWFSRAMRSIPTCRSTRTSAFRLRMRGVPKADHDRLVRKAAEMVELGDYLDRKPRALSGGQRQRAALARAIVRQPQVFLMDEPLVQSRCQAPPHHAGPAQAHPARS